MKAQSSSPPIALTIAGSDSSCGAGLQADLKTFAAHRVYGLNAVTNVIAEVPGEVAMVFPVKANVIKEQLRILFDTYPIASVKTGLLHNPEAVSVVADFLANYRALNERRVHLVVDPVIVDGEGRLFAEKKTMEMYIEKLIPLADIVTPNIDEARALSGMEIGDYQEMKTAGQSLIETHGSSWLIKGGRLSEDEKATDLLCTSKGNFRLEAPRIDTDDTYGAGCALSASIAANMAYGVPLEEAVNNAKRYISHVIERSFEWSVPEAEDEGKIQALDHFAIELVMSAEAE